MSPITYFPLARVNHCQAFLPCAMSSFLSSTSTDRTVTKGPYVLQGVLAGHHGSVICLKVTEDGRILASGGAPTWIL